MTRQEAIKKLQDVQKHSDGSNERAKADTILCDFLDAMGYGDVAFEFRKSPRGLSRGDPQIREAVGPPVNGNRTM